MKQPPAESGRKRPYDGTPLRPVRVEDELWEPVRAITESRGESISEIIRAALREYRDLHECKCPITFDVEHPVTALGPHHERGCPRYIGRRG